jgi:hypothetical protein
VLLIGPINGYKEIFPVKQEGNSPTEVSSFQGLTDSFLGINRSGSGIEQERSKKERRTRFPEWT